MNNIFENLFVLELANNHWGSIERGKKIIKTFANIVKKNNIKAAIKLQFRDVDSFIHKNFKNKNDRYIQKTIKTKLSVDEFKELIVYIRNHDCIPMSTPFDEASVDLCEELNLPIIKIASSDINDWILIKKISLLKKPVIISTGGANDKQINDVVTFFKNRSIPIAINHCVSKYPCEDEELELNQIDYLRHKYPDITIGFSTHEYKDWHSSMLISYAKGVRTWERHIDISYDNFECEQKTVSPYCSLPEQIDEWFKTFHLAVKMCGASLNSRRIIDETETTYLSKLYRGLYLNKSLKKGDKVTLEHIYSAVPYLKEIEQFTSRDYFDNDFILNKDLEKDSPLTRNDVN